jgi:hypothetical protein
MASEPPRLTRDEKERTRRWVARLDAARASLRDEVEADLEQYRKMTRDEADSLRVGVVRGSWRLLQESPNRQALLDYRDPPAPDFDRIWSRLVAEGRQQRNKNVDPAR